MHTPAPLAAASALVLVLAACASKPPVAPALAAATASAEAARAGGAAEFAPAALDAARTKLDRARALEREGKPEQALRLAEEADLDAQYARATAGAERSRRAVAEVETSLRTLREEIQRSSTTPARQPQ
jgi:hypothetical protein